MGYRITYSSGYIEHHGIKGQEWGVQNGPPYPLSPVISTGKRLKIDHLTDSDRSEIYKATEKYAKKHILKPDVAPTAINDIELPSRLIGSSNELTNEINALWNKNKEYQDDLDNNRERYVDDIASKYIPGKYDFLNRSNFEDEDSWRDAINDQVYTEIQSFLTRLKYKYNISEDQLKDPKIKLNRIWSDIENSAKEITKGYEDVKINSKDFYTYTERVQNSISDFLNATEIGRSLYKYYGIGSDLGAPEEFSDAVYDKIEEIFGGK